PSGRGCNHAANRVGLFQSAMCRFGTSRTPCSGFIRQKCSPRRRSTEGRAVCTSPATMYRSYRLTETVLGVGSLFGLVAGAALINDEVRHHLMNLVSGDSATEWMTIAAPAHRAAVAVASTFGDVKAAPSSVVAFGLGALVLFILMFRT